MSKFDQVAFTGVITKIDPQKKMVDVKFTSRSGERKNVTLSYSVVSLTWGRLYMPMVGDKCYLEHVEGNRIVIKSIYPTNLNFLPYLDPGELVDMCENGSYLQLRNRRKKIKSTNELVDVDAVKGPNGETDFEYEPGGITLRVRHKQDPTGKLPRWYNHSYFSMYDNGDIFIQAMNKDKAKALIHLEGHSGYLWMHAGDGKVQEYIELNPVQKEIVILSDGDIHNHAQKNWKLNAYGDEVRNISGKLRINVGVDPKNIDADFDKNISNLANMGDAQISTGLDPANPTTRMSWHDTGKKVEMASQTAVGQYATHTIDGAKTSITAALPNGTQHIIDGIAQTMTSIMPSGIAHILNDLKGQIDTLSQKIGLGNHFDELPTDASAIVQSHLNTLASNIDTKRLADEIVHARMMGAAGIPNAGNYLAAVQVMALDAIGKLGVPNGSSKVRIDI